MEIEDIQYTETERNLPGRSNRLAQQEELFTADGAESGSFASVVLPQPANGFCRKWSFLVCSVNNATADKVALFWDVPTVAPGVSVQLMGIYKISSDIPTGEQLPLIGAHTAACDSGQPAPTGFAGILGIKSCWFAHRDRLSVSVHFTASAGQTITVRGWYRDIPI